MFYDDKSYCKHCGAEVDKDADSCNVCKCIFIDNVAGKKKIVDIKSAVKKKEGIVESLLAFTITGIFLSGSFIGAMRESESNDLVWLIVGMGNLVIIVSFIGIICSCQNISLANRLSRQTTMIRKKISDGELGTDTGGKAGPDIISEPKGESDLIYEYHDDGSSYKWICGFCDGENVTDEARCSICGYLRIQH